MCPFLSGFLSQLSPGSQTVLLVSANEKELQHQVCREQIEIELLRKKLRQATYQLRQIKSKLMDYINVKLDKNP